MMKHKTGLKNKNREGLYGDLHGLQLRFQKDGFESLWESSRGGDWKRWQGDHTSYVKAENETYCKVLVPMEYLT